MDSMDNVRERCEVLEQQTEHSQPHTQALEAQTRTAGRRLRGWRLLPWRMAAVATLGLTLALPLAIQAKTFHCGAGDVQCLIDAINEANANGKKNTIRLETGTYALTRVDNTILGETGLPVVTSPLTITGAGADSTILERDASALQFRLMHVAAAGSLTLRKLTLRGGVADPHFGGGGILNLGTLTMTQTTLANNFVAGPGPGGGILNAAGAVTIDNSTLTGNSAEEGGGIFSSGPLTIRNSTLVRNPSSALGGGIFLSDSGRLTLANSAIFANSAPGAGGGLNTSGTAAIINTTFARNSATTGGGIFNTAPGVTMITNTTIADNQSFAGGGGIANDQFSTGGVVVLLNTVLARNLGQAPDCSVSVTSQGNNLIGDPTGCTITLLPSDLTGDPGLDAFTDNDRPGNGHFPLLPTSQAIDTGNDAACPRRDQLGQRRLNIRGVGTSICDIGAIEFSP